jgi:hypothetical protein
VEQDKVAQLRRQLLLARQQKEESDQLLRIERAALETKVLHFCAVCVFLFFSFVVRKDVIVSALQQSIMEVKGKLEEYEFNAGKYAQDVSFADLVKVATMQMLVLEFVCVCVCFFFVFCFDLFLKGKLFTDDCCASVKAVSRNRTICYGRVDCVQIEVCLSRRCGSRVCDAMEQAGAAI